MSFVRCASVFSSLLILSCSWLIVGLRLVLYSSSWMFWSRSRYRYAFAYSFRSLSMSCLSVYVTPIPLRCPIIVSCRFSSIEAFWSAFLKNRLSALFGRQSLGIFALSLAFSISSLMVDRWNGNSLSSGFVR